LQKIDELEKIEKHTVKNELMDYGEKIKRERFEALLVSLQEIKFIK